MQTSAIQHTGLSPLSQRQLVYVGVHILNLHYSLSPDHYTLTPLENILTA